MEKIAGRIVLAGGIAALFWGVFHMAAIPFIVTDMAAAAGGESATGVAEMASFINLFNACTTAFLLGIGVTLIVGKKSVCQTLLGKMLLIMMVVFWLVRLIAPYFLLLDGVSFVQNISFFDLVFILMAALYFAPLIVASRKPKTAS